MLKKNNSDRKELDGAAMKRAKEAKKVSLITDEEVDEYKEMAISLPRSYITMWRYYLGRFMLYNEPSNYHYMKEFTLLVINSNEDLKNHVISMLGKKRYLNYMKIIQAHSSYLRKAAMIRGMMEDLKDAKGNLEDKGIMGIRKEINKVLAVLNELLANVNKVDAVNYYVLKLFTLVVNATQLKTWQINRFPPNLNYDESVPVVMHKEGFTHQRVV